MSTDTRTSETTETASIDLNADLGEGLGSWSMGDDLALLDIVTSANVACGFHAGDPSIMRSVTQAAADRGVAIGAHVAYRDLHGFGRRFIDMEPDALRDEVLYQIGALETFAQRAGTTIAYCKPHGALYNTIAKHPEQAAAVAEALSEFRSGLPVLGLPGSVWLGVAQETGLTPVGEAFADRAYTPDGSLVSRREQGSVLHEAGTIAERCVAMAKGEAIADVQGGELVLDARSICVHGDTPGAVEIARTVREALAGAGVQVEPFARA
ncbi:LamB/YcsF family protein [Ornithinimicrobium pratense]|uniref:5-oxoprolinase subunit A n=1 Tax=Ornithinimicrobium pratense TaxID=2593973 RepID=A0A5J6V577_9MICO|nr:5-oxoprolinase subunit PxpA [Ornithinimicrobium pratense]QFG68464.1 LamB/YcsF family protein [Ornithinimicrobium pratense]